MKGQENPAELVGICVVMILLSILGILGSFSRDLFGNLDGLLILFVSLMFLLIFGLVLFSIAKQEGWIGKRAESTEVPAKRQEAPVDTAVAAK